LQVPLSHLLLGQSLSRAHWTQAGASRESSQIGVGAAQSAFVAQTTHRPRGPHAFVAGVAAQSALVMHCTQVDSVALHFGAVAGHWVSAVHPARQRNSSGSQTGAAVPQSAFDVHWTQVWVATWQRGEAAGQSVLLSHWTHWDVDGSQSGWVAGQSVFALQPTHTPVATTQSVAFPRQSAFVLHAGWQVWSAGKHAGAATPQSAFVRHAPHLPVPAMQNGADAAHCESAVHWTQPRVASH
jgi:hypothetical protein